MRFGALAGRIFISLLACDGVSSAQVVNVNTPLTSGVAPSSVAAESSAATRAPDSSIRLGNGDLVDVSVYDVPELTTKTRVNGAGDIDMPLINGVHVEGLTVNEATRAIEQRLENGGFVRNPHVQLFVSEYNSDSTSILGEVARPGLYPVLGEQHLFNLLSAAGGLSSAAGRSITITHKAKPDKPVVVQISRNLEDHPDSNVPIYPGDIVMVRRADVVYVVGDVNRPSGFLMDNAGKLSVLQAIALAGGTTNTAKLGGARIIRKGPQGVTELPVSLKKILQAKLSDVPLQADDILFVPGSARKVISGRTAEAALQLASAASLIAIRP